MAKRKSLNRRSSRNKRYTGSDLLDPDTGVLGDEYPYWWKNLENNTMIRPSLDSNVLIQSSRQLDSNSQIESVEPKNEWWKVLDTSSTINSDQDNMRQGGSSNIASASGSDEEEAKVKRRKPPLRSKTKTQRNNIFSNILNDSDGTTSIDFVQNTRRKSSSGNVKKDDKSVTNKKQSNELENSSLNDSSISDNVVKLRPKIFRKGRKKEEKNMFIDALQSNELQPSSKGQSSRTPAGRESVGTTEQGRSNRKENFFDSSASVFSLDGIEDLSNLPAPKAQSTTLEEGSSDKSGMSHDTNNAEIAVVKKKPTFLKRPPRITRTSIFENVFETEESVSEMEKEESIEENVTKDSEVLERLSNVSANDLSKLAHRPPRNVTENATKSNDTKEAETSGSSKKAKASILATQNIKTTVLLEDIVSSYKEPSLTPQQGIKVHNLRKADSANTNVRSKSLTSLDRTNKKQKSAKRLTLDRDIISVRNKESIFHTGEEVLGREEANVDIAEDSENQETLGTNKTIDKSRKRSTAISPSVSNKKKLSGTKYRSRLSSRSGNNEDVEFDTEIGKADIADTNDSNNENVTGRRSIRSQHGDRASIVNASSNSKTAERNDAKNSKKSSTRASNLVKNVSLVSSSNVIQAEDEPLPESVNEETRDEVQRASKSASLSQRKSVAKVSSVPDEPETSGLQTRNRVSNRASNLVSPTRSPAKRKTSSIKGQMSIRNFFNIDTAIPSKQIIMDDGKAEEIRKTLEKMKENNIDDAKKKAKEEQTKLRLVPREKEAMKTKATGKKKVPKQVHKAFLVNGQVYKVPRLPRPKSWVTDRLYKYIWKKLEPKYGLGYRVISEKFIRQLSQVTTIICQQKKYEHYRDELYALMKEMARLGIIRTRCDFYNFCRDFFPYELRIKTIPMLLPGNKRNIPYNPNTLYEPLLQS